MNSSNDSSHNKISDTKISKRKYIGIADTEPSNSEVKQKWLTPQQQALREAAIKKFKSNKVKTYIAKQLRYINSNSQLADGVGYLFDEKGLPPPNCPLEDIVEERKKIEAEIRWFKAIGEELYNKLVQIKEIEDSAMELINEQSKRK